jgi:hypothetical protein
MDIRTTPTPDTASGKYTCVSDEVFAAVTAHPAVQRDFPRGVRFTADPAGRASLGCSLSHQVGGAAAFFHMRAVSGVIAYSPTRPPALMLKDPLLPSNSSFPLGAWEYHAPPASLVATSPPKADGQCF